MSQTIASHSSNSDLDIDIDTNDLTENVSIQLVKSTAKAQFLVNLNTLPSTQATPTSSFHKSFKKSSKSPPIFTKSSKPTPIHKKAHKMSDLFDSTKNPPIKTDLNERCSQFKEKVKAKIEKMAQDQEELRKKDCPFRPQLPNNKRSARKLGEFLAEMKNFEITRDKKLVNMRFRKSQECEKLKIVNRIGVKGKDSELVYEKLYNDGRAVKKITKGTNKEEEEEEEFEEEGDWTGKRVEFGDWVLTEHFKREFFEVVFKNFGKGKTEFVFEEFFRVLVEMNFIRNDVFAGGHKNELSMVYKAWHWVCEEKGREEVTSIERMLEFFLGIMNYREDSEQISVHSEFINFHECRHWFVINKKIRQKALTPNGLSYIPNEPTRKSLSRDESTNYTFQPYLPKKLPI